VLPTHHAASSRHACNVIRPGLRGEWVYCVLSDKPDMKRRSADLDLTNQRSAQLRSISVPYIRAFFGRGAGPRMPKSCSVGLCRNSSANGKRTGRTETEHQTTTIAHCICFPPQRTRMLRIACSHREGSVRMLLLFAVSCPVFVSSVAGVVAVNSDTC